MMIKRTKPMIGNAPVERFNVSLPVEIAEVLRAAGEGNLSAGIRAAAKLLPAKRKRQRPNG
jgi:hypothetical protein